MEPVRQAGRLLAKNGELHITRGGRVLDPDEPFGGPVRFGLPCQAEKEAAAAEEEAAAPPAQDG